MRVSSVQTSCSCSALLNSLDVMTRYGTGGSENENENENAGVELNNNSNSNLVRV